MHGMLDARTQFCLGGFEGRENVCAESSWMTKSPGSSPVRIGARRGGSRVLPDKGNSMSKDKHADMLSFGRA